MIYEYRCKNCENQFEVWAKVSDPAPTACTKCESPELERVIFATNFALKGGGWYSQGYQSSGKGAEANQTVNKTDTKPDKKPESTKIDSAKSKKAES